MLREHPGFTRSSEAKSCIQLTRPTAYTWLYWINGIRRTVPSMWTFRHRLRLRGVLRNVGMHDWRSWSSGVDPLIQRISNSRLGNADADAPAGTSGNRLIHEEPRNSKFELVLGTGPLLSWLFILLMLFAVFFVTGYKVGRNATPPAELAANRDQNGIAAPTNTRPQPASGTAPAGQDSPGAAAEPPKHGAGATTATEPQSTTQRALPAETKTEAAPPAAAPPAHPTSEGSYLQTYSGKQEVAETIANTFKKKGFPTVLSPGPQGKTRVLVGPYPDLDNLGQAKADLERLGFASFRQKIER